MHAVLPRINGTLLTVVWSDVPGIHAIDSQSVKLYVQPTRSSGSVVRYLFHFNSGATYSVDVRYSAVVRRQYINTEFRPVVSFFKQTEGLCGFMDDNTETDLVTSTGHFSSSTTSFVESCKTAPFCFLFCFEGSRVCGGQWCMGSVIERKLVCYLPVHQPIHSMATDWTSKHS